MTITRGRREASAEEIRARQYIASKIKELINIINAYIKVNNK